MANKKIAGITVEIGGDTTKLSKALQDSDKKARELKTELKEVDKALKLDPSNVVLLKQKQDIRFAEYPAFSRYKYFYVYCATRIWICFAHSRQIALSSSVIS
jgi:hypothetical protein